MKATFTTRTSRAAGTLVSLAALALLDACNFAPPYDKPSVQTPSAFKEPAPAQLPDADGWKTAEPRDGFIRGAWWEMFHEPELSALETRAAASNQSVASAMANVLAARAVVNQTRSQYFPAVSAAPSAGRSRQPSALPPASPVTRSQFSAPFEASWEPDFWGRVRNMVKANSLEAQATAADLETVRLAVQSDVAVDYFQLRALDREKSMLEDSALAWRKSAALTQVQQRAGLASGQDTALASGQLAIALAQAVDLGIQRSVLEHAIAALVGEPASSFSIATNAAVTQPVAIPTGVPSQLLERRPDVAAAERRAGGANAQIGVARAAYFPTVTLSGAAGFQSASVGTLFSGPGLVWSVGATMAQTLFDGGLRKAVTAQSRAIYLGAVANYRQTVLTAFQEVEDGLSTLRILSQELRQQNAAVASSESYLSLAVARERSGVDSHLNVIAAQITLLGNERAAVNLRMEQLTASVQLIKALGGGWDVSQLRASAVR